MKKKAGPDRIPSSELTAYERWELPLLDERGNEVWMREEEIDLKPLTAEDLENIRREAMEDGAREGLEKGYREGFDAGRQEGLEAGRSEGYQQGEQAGIEAGEAATRTEVESALLRLQTLMAELFDPLERHTENLESALLNLTLSLTRAVIHRELQLDSSQVRAVLRRALATLPCQDEAIRIHVNPADIDWVRDVAARFEAGSRIVEDGGVLAGGCRVENRNSLVDFTVEKRFQKAVQKMLDHQLRGEPGVEQGELGAMMGELTDFHRALLESSPEPSDQPVAAGDEYGSGLPAETLVRTAADPASESAADKP